MGTGTTFINLRKIILLFLLIKNHLTTAKFSTFGYDFVQGNNTTCAKQFFNLPEEYENDCRIFYIKSDEGKCGEFISDDAKYEDTDELNAQPHLFKRTFNHEYHTKFERIGLNITIPLLNKDSRGYAVIFHVRQFKKCQVIRLNPALKTISNVSVVWNDQFFFTDSDQRSNFTVTLVEIPSLKRQTFHGKVPITIDFGSENADNWRPVLFWQLISNKIVTTFASAEFPVHGYTVELTRGGKFEQKRNVSASGPFQIVDFYVLASGVYKVSVKGNCQRCEKSDEFEINYTFDNPKSLSSILVIASSSILVIIVVLIVLFIAFSKNIIKPKVLRKILIVQSYDCEIHSEFIFALVKALRESHFDVLVDKYRDVETTYDILSWIPEAVKQSHFVLIIWSKGALNKDNEDIQHPGNTVSANWDFALRQVEKKSQDFEFEVANVFWDETVDRKDIKPVFIGFQDIFLTKNLENNWKKLLSFLYSKDFPLWKRKLFKFYKQDLRSFKEGKCLLRAYDNLKSYELDLIPRERNQNGDGMNFPLVEIETGENNDSGFESGRVSNDAFVNDSMVLLPATHLTKRPPKISLKEALSRAENPNVRAAITGSAQAESFPPVFVPYPVAVPVMMVPQVQMPFNRVENDNFLTRNQPNCTQNANLAFSSAGSESAI